MRYDRPHRVEPWRDCPLWWAGILSGVKECGGSAKDTVHTTYNSNTGPINSKVKLPWLNVLLLCHAFCSNNNTSVLINMLTCRQHCLLCLFVRFWILRVKLGATLPSFFFLYSDNLLTDGQDSASAILSLHPFFAPIDDSMLSLYHWLNSQLSAVLC